MAKIVVGTTEVTITDAEMRKILSVAQRSLNNIQASKGLTLMEREAQVAINTVRIQIPTLQSIHVG